MLLLRPLSLSLSESQSLMILTLIQGLTLAEQSKTSSCLQCYSSAAIFNNFRLTSAKIKFGIFSDPSVRIYFIFYFPTVPNFDLQIMTPISHSHNRIPSSDCFGYKVETVFV